MFFWYLNLYGPSFRFSASNYILIWNFHILFGFWLKPHLDWNHEKGRFHDRLYSPSCWLSFDVVFGNMVSSAPDTSVSEFSPSTGFIASIRVYSFSSSLGVPDSWWCSYWFFDSAAWITSSSFNYWFFSLQDVVFDDFAPIWWHLSQSGSSVQINFAHLNICSASSVTAQLNKPVALARFISDHNIEILSLSETWLSSDALPSTLNALTPPNFSFVHQPRLTGKAVGLDLFIVHFSKCRGSLCPLSQHLKRCAYRFQFPHRFSNL